MSLGSELLSTLAQNEATVLTDDVLSEEHIIITSNRYIIVPQKLKRIAVQHDHNIETVTFDCPRYWDNNDMSKMAVYINYMRPDGFTGSYIAQNISIDETDKNIMHFDWTISREITLVQGQLSFLVCIKKTDEQGNETNHWNSELCRDMYISEGMECIAPIISQYPDIVTDLLLRMGIVESGFRANNVSFQNLKSDVDSYTGKIIEALNNSEEALDRVTGDLSEVYDYYFQISDAMPSEAPCVWIDTSGASVMTLSVDGDSDIYAEINSTEYAVTDAGVGSSDKKYSFEII